MAAATGAVLATGAPAAAPAQDLPQACRDAEQVPGTCVGISKLAERASAECRRERMIAEERCAAPFARHVSSDEVSDYAGSWVHKALSIQYRLGNAVPLRDAPWIGTHNSFNSTSEDPTLSHTDSNQQLPLTDQLRIDVRSLELDVHWFPSVRADGEEAPVVCHARGADQGHAGCTTERLLGDALDEIAGWLRYRPDQVLLLYLEDNVDTAAGYDPTAAAIDEHLRVDGRSLVYRTGGSSCRKVPLELTRNDVLAAGAQVVIVSGCGRGAAWRGLVFDWNGGPEVEERPHGYRDFPVCDQDPDGDGRPDISSSDYATKMVRYFEDSTWLSPAASNVGLGSADDGLTPETTRRMVRCGVDLFGFDQILPNDGRLAAAVWSWADGEHFWGGTGCPAQGEDGRWRMLACAESRPAACATPAGGWTIAAAGPYETAAARCAATGLTLGVPRTGNQNARLHQIASSGGASPVWLASPSL